ncbi:hypothetical protein [Geminisphaera colitermitum]|uniref:hypothetical protein n=1 Tax=Geminisphaera colitermitum TaxID=1148786 RepID=UPI0006933CBD|nr:hypothetical protein [Geminisphaera colitermitum]
MSTLASVVRTVSLAALISLLAACSSPSSRIAKNQAAFDTWPVELQEKIRAGEVATGFTQEQVTMAMGKPDRAYTRTTAAGTTEVWAWQSSRPSIGFGIGIAGGSSSGVGVGVGSGIATSSDRNDDRLRVVFDRGIVTAVEKLQE